MALRFHVIVGIGVMASALALSSCSKTDGNIPTYFYDFAAQTVVADRIASACPSLAINDGQKEYAMRRMQAQFDQDGFTAAQQLALPSRVDPVVINAKVAELTTAMNLPDQTPASYCAAGRTQIASGTGVGSFLKEAR